MLRAGVGSIPILCRGMRNPLLAEMVVIMSRQTDRNFIIGEVGLECVKQDIKWGEQNHPDGTGGDIRRSLADMARELCDERAAAGDVTWRHILEEEFQEAMAEQKTAMLRAELIQVAAIAVQWVAAIDRRKPRAA
jgi:hypothetical protein